MALLEVKNVKENIYDPFWRKPGAGALGCAFFGGAERVRGNHGRIRFWENNSFEHSGCVG